MRTVNGQKGQLKRQIVLMNIIQHSKIRITPSHKSVTPNLVIIRIRRNSQ